MLGNGKLVITGKGLEKIMLKKASIAGVSITMVIVAVASVMSYSEDDAIKIEPAADVVMPTKVSRPGCEETDECYVPPEITIQRGAAVTWLNEDSAFHSVTSGLYGAPTGLFDSGHMDPLETFSYTFSEAGVYDYYCTLHPWMQGRVVVE